MYLSRSNINAEIVGANIDNSNYFKNIIWECFHEEKDRNFQFAVDKRQYQIQITVLSEIPPKNSRLLNWGSVNIPDSFLNHNKYEFIVKTNPVRRHHGKSDKAHENPKEWFENKAQENGFKIHYVSSEENGWEPFIKNNIISRKYSVTFWGLIEIVDRDKFKVCFSNGIGRSKTYGFGLLNLKPVV